MAAINEIHKTKIETSEFGKITIDGKTFNRDVIITANGTVIDRPDFAEEKYGTQHIIVLKEIKKILQDNPRVIVIGTGQYGACRLEKGIKEEIEKTNARLLIERTPKAVHLFNNVNDRKAGLFHLTC